MKPAFERGRKKLLKMERLCVTPAVFLPCLKLEAGISTGRKKLPQMVRLCLRHLRSPLRLDVTILKLTTMVLSFILIQNRQFVAPFPFSFSSFARQSVNIQFRRGKTRLAKWYAPYSVSYRILSPRRMLTKLTSSPTG